MRRKVVGVMGSGRSAHESLARPLGRLLAEMGFHLLTGGGQGVMRSVSEAFAGVEGRRGLVIGVLPGDADGRAPDGYPHEYVELVVRTHLPFSGEDGTDVLSRNHVNVLSADAVVALPGSTGTASEVRLALRYGRPVIAFLGADGRIAGTRPDGVASAESLGDVERFLRPLVTAGSASNS